MTNISDQTVPGVKLDDELKPTKLIRIDSVSHPNAVIDDFGFGFEASLGALEAGESVTVFVDTHNRSVRHNKQLKTYTIIKKQQIHMHHVLDYHHSLLLMMNLNLFHHPYYLNHSYQE